MCVGDKKGENVGQILGSLCTVRYAWICKPICLNEHRCLDDIYRFITACYVVMNVCTFSGNNEPDVKIDNLSLIEAKL